MIEKWINVPSYPWIEASSLGRIKAFYIQKMPYGGQKLSFVSPTFGYEVSSICGGKSKRMTILIRRKTFKIHQLVCEAFHGKKTKDKAIVLHIDEDGTNNRPENLKWGTQKENLNAAGFIKYCKSRTGENNPCVKGKKKYNNKKNTTFEPFAMAALIVGASTTGRPIR